MDSPAVQAYLADLEKSRLQIEDRLIHLPETSCLLNQFDNKLKINVRDYLHAVPIVSSLIRSFVYSPRTNETINQRCMKAGFSCPFDPPLVGRVLTIFAFACIYKKCAKETESSEFAKQFSTVLCLSSYDYTHLKQIDWAVKVISESRKSGPENWLAPAMLIMVQLTGLESTEKARAIAGFVEQYEVYVGRVWEAAKNNRVLIDFPW
ncbi:MAG: hypothetical protein ACI376_08580 [Candidatus Bruticola sp.]